MRGFLLPRLSYFPINYIRGPPGKRTKKMEGIQQERKPDGIHVGLPIEEEVRAIVAREKRHGNSIGSMHRQIAKSAEIASSLSRLFTLYGVETAGNSDDTITT